MVWFIHVIHHAFSLVSSRESWGCIEIRFQWRWIFYRKSMETNGGFWTRNLDCYQWSQSKVRTLAVGKLCRKASQRQLPEPHRTTEKTPLLRWAYGASMAATCWTRGVRSRRPWCYGRWSKRIHTRLVPWTIWRWLSIAKGVCMLLLILGVWKISQKTENCFNQKETILLLLPRMHYSMLPTSDPMMVRYSWCEIWTNKNCFSHVILSRNLSFLKVKCMPTWVVSSTWSGAFRWEPTTSARCWQRDGWNGGVV